MLSYCVDHIILALQVQLSILLRDSTILPQNFNMRFFIFGLLLIVIGCGDQIVKSSTTTDNNLTSKEALAITAEAYLYGYPLILMDLTMKATTNAVRPHPVRPLAPINQLGHFRRFPDPTLRTVVKPNVDTYYSIAWLDLKEEPIILKMPATDRYYLMQFLDAYTDVFASIGTRTTGTAAQEFMIVGPNWKGEIPNNVSLHRSSTNMVWMLGRIQTNSNIDGRTVVRAIQDSMSVYPLSVRGAAYVPPPGVFSEEWEGITPSKKIEAMDIETALGKISELMIDNPPRIKDSLLVRRLSKIGISPGQAPRLDFDDFVLKQKLSAIPSMVGKKFRERRSNPDDERKINNWMMVTSGLGDYQTEYPTRAYIAFMALGANLAEDAVYPNTTEDVNGNPLLGSKKYIIHMDKNELPPVNAFWSLTAYNEDEFLIENEINRYALGDQKNIKYNEDGSLDLFIQSDAPETSQLSNWLPTTKEGPFSLTLRLYWPKPEILSRTWTPPSVIPVTD